MKVILEPKECEALRVKWGKQVQEVLSDEALNNLANKGSVEVTFSIKQTKSW